MVYWQHQCTRKEAAEPYIVPFKYDHPRHVFTNIIDAALLRAVRYSSTLSAFNEERHSIKLMLLYNGYPPRYIYNRFKQFFTSNIHISSIMPFIDNEKYFTFIRDYLINKTTVTEHKIASRIAKTIDPNNNNTIDDPLVQLRLRQRSKWDKNLIIHYTHEARLENCKTNIHQLWNQLFNNTEVMDTKLVIGNRNSPNITKILVHPRAIPNPHRYQQIQPVNSKQNQ